MRRTAVVCFAKDPLSENSKTRLSASVGKRLAAQFSTLSFEAIQETLVSVQQRDDVEVIMAVNESKLVKPAFASQSQGQGGFNDRLERVYQAICASYNAVIFIGTDSPQLSSDDLYSAVEILNREAFIIGKTFDGGFYLFGTSLVLPKGFWLDLPTGTEKMAEATISKLPADCLPLPSRVDVDIEPDLTLLQQELSQMSSLTTSQCKLLDWLKAKKF
ncbi:DUF2064 domain-containing protein [Oligoflexaceae bacterium]|nr:DUF2064 domain-containing protein [Oligoflexaceae bacterium]